jgi:hypothetical protein
MALDKIFVDLELLEEANIRSLEIDENGVFQYLFNSPTRKIDIPLADTDKDHLCVVIPICGDLLLSVEVTGKFKSATLFQYDWTGSREIVYYTMTEPGVCIPFPHSGIPLTQIGKAIYLKVEGASENINIAATYAYLESYSRKALAEYRTKDQNGVKAVHADQTIYQVLSVTDYGFSPNCFHPVT